MMCFILPFLRLCHFRKGPSVRRPRTPFAYGWFAALARVVAAMALLAESGQVVVGVVGRAVVEVGGGEDDLSGGDEVRMAVDGAVASKSKPPPKPSSCPS